jgi:hypothetical protein
MSSRSLSNGRLEVVFDKSPLAISRMTNLLTGKQFCVGGSQSLIVRTPQAISDPTFLTEVESVTWSPDSVHFLVKDAAARTRAQVSMAVTDDGIAIHLHASAPTPIWVVEWRLARLSLDEVIVPALGGQALSSEMPSDTMLTYKYPFWWNSQFALGMMRGGGVWLRTMDIHPVFKFLRVRKTADHFTLAYGVEANAPLRSGTLEAMWYLDCFRGSWRVPTDIHRVWLEKSLGLARLEENRFLPKWARDIDIVLELWGIGKDSPEPLHTYDQMVERLKQWRTLHDPSRTLVYLPGFAEHGIDSHAPDYAPSPQLGGRRKFRALVDTAHRMGYPVMVHTNALCMTFDHRLYDRFRKYQVRDAFGQRQGWGLDIDGDWLAEPYFAYINPGARAWGDLMEKVIGALIREDGVDAVFLDQTLLAFNVSRGPNFIMGMRKHIQRLQRAFPETLFAGEGIHEHVLGTVPIVQIHGIDSLTEVHGMEGRKRWRFAHPLLTYLFGPYALFTAHLLTRHPTHHSFRFQEASYAKLGVIPALCLYHHDQKIDLPEVRKMIRRAKQL